MQKLADAKGYACAELKVVCTREEKKKKNRPQSFCDTTGSCQALYGREQGGVPRSPDRLAHAVPSRYSRHVIILWHHPSSSWIYIDVEGCRFWNQSRIQSHAESEAARYVRCCVNIPLAVSMETQECKSGVILSSGLKLPSGRNSECLQYLIYQ